MRALSRQPKGRPEPWRRAGFDQDLSSRLDEWETGAIPMTALLEKAGYDPSLMPPERRSWFQGFLEDCRADLQQAAVTAGRTEAFCDREVADIATQMIRYGVAAHVIGIVNLSHDSDAKDRRRGWEYGASHQLSQLRRDGVREILRSIVETRDVEAWRAFPQWFSTWHDVERGLDWMRGAAARWLPTFAGPIDPGLLADPNRRVRRATAMHWAEAGLPTSAALIAVLRDAASDTAWIWSNNDHYDHCWTGQDSALEALLTAAPELDWAREACRRLIAEATTGRSPEEQPWLDRRADRLRAALARAEGEGS